MEDKPELWTPEGGGDEERYEYYEAEFLIDEEMPEFTFDVEVPYFTMRTEVGPQKCHWLNTTLCSYEEPFEFLEHVYITRPGDIPLYVFKGNLERDGWQTMIQFMVEHDFPLEYKPLPSKVLLEMYYNYARGQETIEDIIERIYDGD